VAVTKLGMVFDLSTNPSNTAQGHRVGGWTEWVYAGEAPSSSLTTRFNNLCAARAAFLPASARIVGQKTLIVEPRGGSAQAGVIFTGNATYGTDVPQMSLMCKIGSAAWPNIRTLELRGFPDSLVFQGEYKPDGTIEGLLANFATQLEVGNFSFRGRNLNNPLAPISSIAANGTVVLAQDLVFNEGDLVQVLRTNDENGNRVGGFFFVLDKTDARNLVLSNWTSGQTFSGKLRIASTVYPAFQAASFAVTRVNVRKVGRPSGGYSGRRSARR